jgi:outer membrane protein OmpA-like peptidoglycan-associated protein/outer membrane protein W
MSMNRPAVAAALLLGAALSASAFAQDDWRSTDWIVRGGISQVDPKSRDLALSPTAKLGVDDDTGFSFDITKMLSEKWGLELFAAPSLKHSTTTDTATTSTPFGKVEPVIQTLTGQYHFNPAGRARPYIGAGVGYAQFNGETPAGLSLGRSWGPTAVAGIDLGITKRFFVNASARYVDMSSKVRLNGANVGTVNLDPMIYSVNLGYRFGSAAPVAVAAGSAIAAIAPAVVAKPVVEAPKDSDGDGVIDPNDMCPDTPRGTRVGPQGCPCDLTLKLNFAFDSATLTDADKAQLDAAATELKRLNWTSGVIEGHTDSIGSDAYNQKLSDRRVAAVRDYLISQGIAEGRMAPKGFGESQPVADNKTAEGRAENRRVVLRRTDCDKPQ